MDKPMGVPTGGDLILGCLEVQVLEVQGLDAGEKGQGVFCSVICQQQEQRTAAVAPDRELSRRWNATFEFETTDSFAEGDRDVTIIVKETRNITQKRAAGATKEEEFGRVRVALDELEQSRSVDRWFPLQRNQKFTSAIIHLKFNYEESKLSELVSIISGPPKEETPKEKLSISALQYNVVRVLLALMPVIRIFKQINELSKWRNPAAALFIIQTLIFVCVFDYLATAVCILGSAHMLYRFYLHFKETIQVQDEESKKRRAEEKEREKGPKTSIFEKMKKAQAVAGKIADRIEPLHDLWEWKDPKKSKLCMYLGIAGSILFLFMDWTIVLRYGLLFAGLFLFTLRPLYLRYPRFKARYHYTVVGRQLKVKLRVLYKRLAIYLRKRKSRINLMPKTTVKSLLAKQPRLSGFLCKQGIKGNTFKRRYFMAVDSSLYYFKSDNPTERVAGWIELTRSSVNEPAEEMREFPHSFDLYDKDLSRHFILSAESEKEKREWMDLADSMEEKPPVLKSSFVSPPRKIAVEPLHLQSVHQHQQQLSKKDSGKWSTSEMTSTTYSEPLQRAGTAPLLSPRQNPSPRLENVLKERKRLAQEVMAATITDAVKIGWLNKMGEKRKAWKKRYFILSNNNLYYFKKSSPREPAISFLPLDGSQVLETSEKRHPYCIDIFVPSCSRHYLIAAKDDTERSEWLEACRSAASPFLGDLQPPKSTPLGLVDSFENSGDLEDEEYAVPIETSRFGRKDRKARSVSTRDAVSSQKSVWKRNTMITDTHSIALEDSGKITLGELTSPAKIGFLAKQEVIALRKVWKRRFCVLSRGALFFFASNGNKEVALDCISVVQSKLTELPGLIRGKQFCFELSRVNPMRQVYLAAESEAERGQWTRTIANVGETIAMSEGLKRQKTREDHGTPSVIANAHRLIESGIEPSEVDALLEKARARESQPAGENETEEESKKHVPYAQFVEGRESLGQLTLVHASVEAGSLELVKLLVEKHHADINARDAASWTPLHTAAQFNKLDIYSYLLNNGADANALTSDYTTPLHFLVCCESRLSPMHLDGDEDSELSEAPTTARTRAGGGGFGTAFALPNTLDNEQILLALVKETLDHGANINAQNTKGDSVLHFAVRKGHFRVVKYLLDRQADVTLRNKRNHAPSEVAELCNNTELSALLKAYEMVAMEERQKKKVEQPKQAPVVPTAPKPILKRKSTLSSTSASTSPTGDLNLSETPSENTESHVQRESEDNEETAEEILKVLQQSNGIETLKEEAKHEILDEHKLHNVEPEVIKDVLDIPAPIPITQPTVVTSENDSASESEQHTSSIGDEDEDTEGSTIGGMETSEERVIRTRPVSYNEGAEARRLSIGVRKPLPALQLPRADSMQPLSPRSANSASVGSLPLPSPRFFDEDDMPKAKTVTVGDLLLDGATVTGHLKMRVGTIKKTWKRFYFVLRGHDFFYFPTAGNKEKAAGCIDVRQMTIEAITEEVKGEKHCFALQQHAPRSKRFQLAADTPDESARWMHSLTSSSAF